MRSQGKSGPDAGAVSPAASRETIAAVSTAPGRAAIAVVRISGPGSAQALRTLCSVVPPPRRAVYRPIRDPRDGRLIDRGIAIFFEGPRTATGEDLAELHVHGGRAVVSATLDALLSAEGVRLAEPGEFTRRAVSNGRLDLAQAEGLADLLAAETEAQRRQAIRQSDGELSRRVEGWRARLVRAMALIEAGIDFIDEDGVPADVARRAQAEVRRLDAELSVALADTRGERLRDGFRVAIAGAPNAGKSSLLNALAGRDAAIVTSVPGTTRDVIEIHLDLGGFPAIVADTAGLRGAEDIAEQEGVRRAMAYAAAADLVVWLEDASSPAAPDLGVEARTLWRVASKIDLSPAPVGAEHAISVHTGAGLDAFVMRLADEARASLDAGEATLVTRARHREALAATAALTERALAKWDAAPPELLADDLRHAADALGRIAGRVGVEDVLGEVFSNFCIGK